MPDTRPGMTGNVGGHWYKTAAEGRLLGEGWSKPHLRRVRGTSDDRFTAERIQPKQLRNQEQAHGFLCSSTGA